MLEYIILGALNLKPFTGYDIRSWIEGGIGMFYKASYGSIYPLLNKLLDQGDITCSNENQGKRVKKVYSITPTGREVFMEWLENSEETGNSMESFIAKVFFFDQLPMELSSRIIETYEKKLEIYLNQLLELKKQYDALENTQQFYYKISTLYYGICKLQSMIMWCETVKSQKSLDNLVMAKEEKDAASDSN